MSADDYYSDAGMYEDDPTPPSFANDDAAAEAAPLGRLSFPKEKKAVKKLVRNGELLQESRQWGSSANEPLEDNGPWVFPERETDFLLPQTVFTDMRDEVRNSKMIKRAIFNIVTGMLAYIVLALFFIVDDGVLNDNYFWFVIIGVLALINWIETCTSPYVLRFKKTIKPKKFHKQAMKYRKNKALSAIFQVQCWHYEWKDTEEGDEKKKVVTYDKQTELQFAAQDDHSSPLADFGSKDILLVTFRPRVVLNDIHDLDIFADMAQKLYEDAKKRDNEFSISWSMVVEDMPNATGIIVQNDKSLIGSCTTNKTIFVPLAILLLGGWMRLLLDYISEHRDYIILKNATFRRKGGGPRQYVSPFEYIPPGMGVSYRGEGGRKMKELSKAKKPKKKKDKKPKKAKKTKNEEDEYEWVYEPGWYEYDYEDATVYDDDAAAGYDDDAATGYDDSADSADYDDDSYASRKDFEMRDGDEKHDTKRSKAAMKRWSAKEGMPSATYPIQTGPYMVTKDEDKFSAKDIQV